MFRTSRDTTLLCYLPCCVVLGWRRGLACAFARIRGGARACIVVTVNPTHDTKKGKEGEAKNRAGAPSETAAAAEVDRPGIPTCPPPLAYASTSLRTGSPKPDLYLFWSAIPLHNPPPPPSRLTVLNGTPGPGLGNPYDSSSNCL